MGFDRPAAVPTQGNALPLDRGVEHVVGTHSEPCRRANQLGQLHPGIAISPDKFTHSVYPEGVLLGEFFDGEAVGLEVVAEGHVTKIPDMGNTSRGESSPPLRVLYLPGLGTSGTMKNRIAELRKAKGLTQTQLAELAGTTKSQIVKLELGHRRLSDHWAARLAPHLGAQPYELLMPAGSVVTLRQVPLIGRISCGNWREAVEHADGLVPTISGGPNAFALRPEGDSMNLLDIDESGYVVVDPDQLDLINGKIYAVMNGDGETTLKKYSADPARLVPCSSNPAHKEVHVGQDHFTVIGRIVWRGNPL